MYGYRNYIYKEKQLQGEPPDLVESVPHVPWVILARFFIYGFDAYVCRRETLYGRLIFEITKSVLVRLRTIRIFFGWLASARRSVGRNRFCIAVVATRSLSSPSRSLRLRRHFPLLVVTLIFLSFLLPASIDLIGLPFVVLLFLELLLDGYKPPNVTTNMRGWTLEEAGSSTWVRGRT